MAPEGFRYIYIYIFYPKSYIYKEYMNAASIRCTRASVKETDYFFSSFSLNLVMFINVLVISTGISSRNISL